MAMNLSRYREVRERLVKLYRILSYQTFPVFITPSAMMSTEELRDRPYYSKEGFANDTDYYSRHELRHMQIPNIMEIIPNLTSEADIGFQNPNETLVMIYESVQEYIALWVEIMREAPEFKHPPIDELRALEDVAYLVYDGYSKIKPYLNRMSDYRAYEEDKMLKARGLGGLAALLKANPNRIPGEMSFVSHLDEFLQTSPGSAQGVESGPSIASMPMDGIMAPESPGGLESWLFNQGVA